MKNVLLLFLISFIVLWSGCSSSEDTVSKHNMQVISAIYEHWSEPPPPGSDVPERGTDIVVTVRNWPQGFTPDYIIHNKRRSLSTTIADSTQSETIISARIVRSSSILADPSESVAVSDRLVYSNADGEEKHVEIKEWKQAELE